MFISCWYNFFKNFIIKEKACVKIWAKIKDLVRRNTQAKQVTGVWIKILSTLVSGTNLLLLLKKELQ